jgi:hypothetical protein
VFERCSNYTVLRQLNPLRTFKSYFFKIHLNSFVLSAPRSPIWTFPMKFVTAILYGSYVPHACYFPRPSRLLCLVESASYEAHSYTVFSSLVIVHPS